MLSRIETVLIDLIPSLVTTLSQRIYKDLRRKRSAVVENARLDRQGFDKRLAKQWKVPLALLGFLHEMAFEAGSSCVMTIVENKEPHPRHVLEVVKRLHARSCQIVSEVLVLLRTGHADGAHARWRSMHEIAVVASFVQEPNRGLREVRSGIARLGNTGASGMKGIQEVSAELEDAE
jgi:Family of unknown function (DUF5677)